MSHSKWFKNSQLVLLGALVVLFAFGANAWAATQGKPIAVPFEHSDISVIMESMPVDIGRHLDDPGDVVDFDAALIAAGNYLKQFQADGIVGDNAGNGPEGSESPDDPDDGGWNWVLNWDTDPHFHSTAASSTNLYGVTALGLYYAYIATSDATYWTALMDAATNMVADPEIDSGADLKFLMLFDDLYDSEVTPTSTYEDAAKAKYDARIATHGSATAWAEYIRDVRGASYPNGIIAWDIGIWVVDAQMLYDRYGATYDADADAMAEVLWQDSFNDTPGYFDIVDDAGWDPTYSDVNFWWYTLGITGLIDAFDYSGSHTAEIAGLITILQDCQYTNGAFSYCYGANTDDEDWQSTAYAAMTLKDYDATTYSDEIKHAAYWSAATQHSGGGWVYSSSGNHYPEVGGENTCAVSFGSNPDEVWVDDDWTSQADVDDDNPVEGNYLVWGYDAFGNIQDAMDAVSGSTINLLAGTYYGAIQINTVGLNLIGAGEGVVTIDVTGTDFNGAGIYVNADDVVLEGFTVQSNGSNPPRYGIKVADVDGDTLRHVTVQNIYRSGVDCLGSSNLTILDVTSQNNGGHGLSLVDCNGAHVTDMTFSGNGWQNVSVATWGCYTPLGTSGIVFDGAANTFGDLFQLEMGDFNNPTFPPAGAAIITYSTNILDGADVTVQASDFGFALHGEQDDSPDQVRIWFFSTLANAAIVPGLGGGGHWTGNDMYIESLTDGTQLYVTPGCSIQAAIDAASSGDDINVSAGTYPGAITMPASMPLTLVGAGMTQTFLTGGMVLSGGADGITLKQFAISGLGASSSVLRAMGTNTDFSMDYCLVDGGGVAGRHGYSGGLLEGDATFTYCEFKNVNNWSLMDSKSGSGGDGSAMGTITFANNYIHECDGSIVFRGLSTDRTDLANVYNNTWENIGDNFTAPSQHWAAFELNRCVTFNFYNNTIDGVALGQWSEGQGLQCWDIDNLSVYDNEFIDCYQGIWIYCGGVHAIPGGTITNNAFLGCTDYTLQFDNTCPFPVTMNIDGNCWSDFGSNAGFPVGEYWVYDSTPSHVATDHNPNTNACGNVDFIVTSDYLGCEAACLGDTLYLTFDQIGYITGQVFVQLPTELDADWAAGTQFVSVMPGTNVAPNLNFSAARRSAGNQIEVNVSWAPPYSDGDGTKYIACIPIKNVSATGGETLVISGASSTFYDAGGAHVDEFTLGSATLYVDCADPVATMVYTSPPACDGFGASSQMENTISIDVLRGAVPLNSPLESGYVEVNGDALKRITVFDTPQAGDYFDDEFPNAADAVTLWSYLSEGCDTLVLHAFDTECNEGVSSDLVVVKDLTAPDLTVDNRPRCYSPNTYLLLDDSLDITTDLSAGGQPLDCYASTGQLEISYLSGPAFSLALDVTNYPADDAEALALWTWIVNTSGVPGTADGENYTFDVEACDCAGNCATDDFTICIDLTAPSNTFTDFDARPTHLGVWLKWVWTYSATQAVEVEIYRAPENTYPVYGAPTKWNNDADYEKDHGNLGTWTLVATQTGPQNTSGAFAGRHAADVNYWLDSAATWVNGSGSAFRDIYRYVTFVKDDGGNWSQVGSYTIGTDADRSTNYWLGDYTPDPVGVDPSPWGVVSGSDLSMLSGVYFTTVGGGSPPTEAFYDIGPENAENGIGKGIPTPDTNIDFLDLVPFSFNFGVALPGGFNVRLPDTKPFSGLDEQPVVSMSCSEDDNLVITVGLSGNIEHAVKVAEAELHFDSEVLELVSAIEGNIEVLDGVPFALTRPVEGRENAIGMTAAAMGEIACISGDFTLATLEFRWTDERVTSAEIELTSIRLADGHGNIIEGGGTILAVNAGGAIPLEFALHQNYPNPFNPTTQILFDLAKASDVRLMIYNLLGQEVRTLIAGQMPAGKHHIAWNGCDNHGQIVSSGLYLYQLRAGDFVSSRKMFFAR